MTTWYRTGTIAVTNGSVTVTGTGTAWIENARIGDALHAPDGRVYEVANVVSDTSLTLASNFLGSTASGQDYAIQPTRGVIASFRDTVQTWISSIQTYIDGALAGRFGDGTQSEPGVAFANDLDTGVRRSGSNELRVVSGGSDRVTVNSSGNVGIGTASPTEKLDVAGNIQLSGSVSMTTSGALLIGSGHGASTDSNSTAIGKDAQALAAFVTATGVSAANGNTGTNVTATGYLAARDNTAAFVTATGNVAAFNNTGTNVTATGYFAARDNSGDNVTATGYFVARDNSGDNVTATGYLAARDNSGNDCVFLGYEAGRNNTAANQFIVEQRNVNTTPLIQGDFSSGNVGIGTTSPSAKLDVNGSLSKSSGSFKIDHPLLALRDTHYLVHSFVEGPRADNIYRGRAVLVGGTATVDIDAAAGMTSGTFEALNGDVQVWVQNDTGWEPVRGEVVGTTLTITCRDGASTDIVSWLVIGERQDQHMLDTQWTDEFGRVTVEPLKPAPEEEPA